MRRWATILAGVPLALGLALAVGWVVDQGRAVPPQDVPLPAITAAGGQAPFRMVVLGTSLSHRASWPDAVARMLAACLGRGTEVARLTQPGAASDWGLAEAGAVAALAPDLVTIEFAINDADLWDGLALGDSRENHARLVADLRGRGIAVLLIGTNPVGRVAALKRPFLPLYQDIYPALARQAGAGFLDGERRWRARPDWRAALADGVHPGPAIEAEIMAVPMARLIGRAMGVGCGGVSGP